LLAARTAGTITMAVGGVAAACTGLVALATTLLHDPAPEPLLPAPLSLLELVQP
jgi:hypothetical protein